MPGLPFPIREVTQKALLVWVRFVKSVNFSPDIDSVVLELTNKTSKLAKEPRRMYLVKSLRFFPD